MAAYLGKRFALLGPVLLLITLVVFLMRALIPGDPVDMMTLGQNVDREAKEALREALGLNKPLPAQYGDFLRGLARGDLGRSVRTRQPVAAEIAVRYPNTVRLALASMLVAVLVGVGAGVWAAVRKDSVADVSVMFLVSIGVSMPAFWLGMILMYTFGVKYQLFPVMGYETAKHLVLPAGTLGLIFSALIARMTRSSLLEVLSLDYIRTARAKGLAERVVIFRHALRNALIPVVTVIGLQFGFLLGGAFVVEVVFAFHGLGELMVQSIQYRDFPVVQAITLVVAVSTVLLNLTIDVIYSLLNPQIRYV